MGNNPEQGQRVIEPEGQRGPNNSKISHTNTHSYKAPPVIYEAGSVTGSRLQASKIGVQDLNDYIHTKIPKFQNSERFSRGEDYASEEAEMQSVKPVHEEEEIRQVTKKRNQLKMDNLGGISGQISVPHFDYDRKLLHLIEYPEKAASSA